MITPLVAFWFLGASVIGGVPVGQVATPQATGCQVKESTSSEPMAADTFPRAVHVVVCNETTAIVHYAGRWSPWGRFATAPAVTIAPLSYDEFDTVADFTIAASVRYFIGSANIVLSRSNPFIGKNMAAYSTSSPDFAVDTVGNEGNRTVLQFFIRTATQGPNSCNVPWLVSQFSTSKQGQLSWFDVATGFISTPFKKMGISGWTGTGCKAVAQGYSVNRIGHSTDGFYTLDLKITSASIERTNESSLPGHFIRVEFEPHNRAHEKVATVAQCLNPSTDVLVRVGGVVKIDEDGPFLEIHPNDPYGDLEILNDCSRVEGPAPLCACAGALTRQCAPTVAPSTR
jgi:hypothetical protein